MENKHRNKLFTGFFLGAVLGSAAVFLLGTKQGKKVLQKLTHEGIDGIEDLRKLLTEKIDDEIVPEKKKLLKTASKKRTP